MAEWTWNRILWNGTMTGALLGAFAILMALPPLALEERTALGAEETLDDVLLVLELVVDLLRELLVAAGAVEPSGVRRDPVTRLGRGAEDLFEAGCTGVFGGSFSAQQREAQRAPQHHTGSRHGGCAFQCRLEEGPSREHGLPRLPGQELWTGCSPARAGWGLPPPSSRPGYHRAVGPATKIGPGRRWEVAIKYAFE